MVLSSRNQVLYHGACELACDLYCEGSVYSGGVFALNCLDPVSV